jgi:histidinol phosphatase-like enzyme
MNPDDIVLTFPFTDEIKPRFNYALSEYEKLHKSMNEKLTQFNEKFDKVYFLLNKNERVFIFTNPKFIMLEIKECENTINKIKSILTQSTVTDEDLCFLETDLEWQYTHFNSQIKNITNEMNESAES